MEKKVSRWFERFRSHVLMCAREECPRKQLLKRPKRTKADTQIGLGVLLWGMGAIAEADGRFLPEENKKIEDTILSYTKITRSDLPVVLTAVKQAAIGKVNFYRIVRQINKTMPKKAKISLIGNLFRIAYADKSLDDKEFRIIKKVSDLFDMTREDMSEINEKIKKEAAGISRSSA